MLLSKENNPKMEEVRKYIPVSASSNFDTLAPHIVNIERDYLVPVIGQDMYDRISNFYSHPIPNPSSGAEAAASDKKMDTLLTLTQSAVLHLAYWIGYDLLNVEVTGSGFRRTESDKVKGLMKHQDESLKGYFRTNGFNGIDTVLQYLEQNIKDFVEFSASDEYTLLKSYFIPNTLIFDKIVFINKSRLTFLRMKPHMQLVEDAEIAPILGPVSFEFVKTQMMSGEPVAKVTKLLEYIRKPVAYLASALLMEDSGADLKDNGLYFTSTIPISINDTEYKPSDGDRIHVLVQRNRNLGNAYLDQLRSYLIANAAEWENVPQSTGKVLNRDNRSKKTFWT